ncbi:MAG: tetratricopeptide repeat protein [Oscillospiraceae bacterium]|nr:tetratricopeptide repeat protein [Oscillospiraceae bacterium]
MVGEALTVTSIFVTGLSIFQTLINNETFPKFAKLTIEKSCKTYFDYVSRNRREYPDNYFTKQMEKSFGEKIFNNFIATVRRGEEFTPDNMLPDENFSDCKNLYKIIEGNFNNSFEYGVRSDLTSIKIDVAKITEMLEIAIGKMSASHAPLFPKVVTRETAPAPSHYFVGRETEREDIKNQLANNRKLMLVNGMGGIGKSEICKKLFHELDMPHMGWVVFNKNVQETLHGKFTAIDETDFDENVRKTIAHINDLNSALLLFIDNMNEPSEEDWGVINSLSCNIIITSRLTDVDRIKPITIGKLSENLCVSLYKDILGRNCDDEIVKELVKKADYLTIVVELLAKTARDSGDSDRELLDKLNKCGFSLYEITDDVDGKTFKEHMQKLFDVSEVKDKDKNEFHILKIFSLFPPIPLETKIAKRWLELPNSNLLNRLAKRGWLIKKGSTFYMHHVISDVVRFENMPTYDDCTGLVDKINEDLGFNVYEVFTTRLGILPFGESVAGWLEGDENSQREDNFAVLHSRIASLYNEQGKYDTALEYLNKSLAIFEKVLGKEHPNIAMSYNNIACVYEEQGDYVQALKYHNKSLAICEKVLGKEHPNTATSYNNIGFVYKAQGDYVQALKYYNKALAIFEKVLDTEHPNIAKSYANISAVYYEQGDYVQALEYHNKALAIHEKVLGKEHPDTAVSYNNIGFIYVVQGDYVQALEYYNKALAIREKVLGKKHPSTIDSAKSLEYIRTLYL